MKKRIETKTSRTAEMTCLVRAISYYEKDACYRTDDYLAPQIIPSFLNLLARLSICKYVYKHFAPQEIYAYVIARTKYIDAIFAGNLGKIEQILIFGAGFDSRAIRFHEKLQQVNFFELDSPITQNAKIKRLQEKKIAIPSNITYIPIDFAKESLPQKLDEAGFIQNKACLFLLEGLTIYLDPQSIDATFKLISEYAGKESIIIFDYVYASVIRQEKTYHGEKELYQSVSTVGEKWSFGIEKGEIGNFLSKYDFTLLDEATAEILEQKYFRNQAGDLAGRITGTHALVTAKK